jgi:hypothetical protein
MIWVAEGMSRMTVKHFGVGGLVSTPSSGAGYCEQDGKKDQGHGSK